MKLFDPTTQQLNPTPVRQRRVQDRPPLPEPPHDAIVRRPSALDLSNETYEERVRAGQRVSLPKPPSPAPNGETFPCKDCARFAFHKPGVRCWWCRQRLGDDGELPF